MLLITEGTFVSPYSYLGLVEVKDHLPLTDVTITATIKDIIDVVGRYTGVTEQELKGRRGKREITDARFMVWTFARKYTSGSLKHVGTFTGDRDHSTILHGIRTLKELMSQRQNGQLRNTYDNCERHLKLYFSDVKR